MSITPRGMSVTEAYRSFRAHEFVVNRRYQRKLVWTEEEKAALIDSILRQYPIPLILLAEHRHDQAPGKYQIIDGMQRLNAIFSFIENAYSLDEKYFDTNESARAKQAAEDGIFEACSPERSSAYARRLC